MDFQTMTVVQLRDYANKNGIDIRGVGNKQGILDAIQAVITEQNAPEKSGETSALPEETSTAEVAETATSEGEEQPSEPETPNEPPADTVTENISINRILFASRRLMKGGDVDAVHAALIERGLHVGQDSVQGIYGARTAVAVRHFQSRNRLIVDGRVGKFTARALGFEWEG